MESIRISTVDTAKMIRKALKKYYPNIKFRVLSSSYAGGSSITAHWTDGPTQDEINKILKSFEGASFDGMIDLKSYQDVKIDGQNFHFGSDYVFPNRSVSDDNWLATANDIIGEWAACSDWEKKTEVKQIFAEKRQVANQWFSQFVGREIAKTSYYNLNN